MEEGVLGSGRAANGLENNSDIRVRSDQPIFQNCQPTAGVLMAMLAEPGPFPLQRSPRDSWSPPGHWGSENARPLMHSLTLRPTLLQFLHEGPRSFDVFVLHQGAEAVQVRGELRRIGGRRRGGIDSGLGHVQSPPLPPGSVAARTSLASFYPPIRPAARG